MKKKILYVNDIANTAPAMVAALSRTHNVVFKQFPQRGNYPNSFYLLCAQIIYGIYLAFIFRKFDIAYVNYGHFAAFTFLSKKPLYLHCHGTDLRNSGRNIFHILTSIALKRSEKIFISTPNLIEFVPRDYKSKCTFLPNALNTDNFQIKKSDNAYSKRNSSLKILIISKLDETKGITQIFNALPEIVKMDEITKISYFNFGNLSVKPHLQLNSKFNPISKIPYTEIPKLIYDHDVVIGQLELGAIGMSELEAMWCSKPVIAKFNYDDHYLEPSPIIKVNNSAEIITAISELIKNPSDLNLIGKRSHDWVVKYHTKDALIKKYADLLS